MKTENARVMVDDPQGLALVKSYLASIEAQDLGGLMRLLAPDVELVHDHRPVVGGRREVIDMIDGYLRLFDGVEFDVRTVLGSDGIYFVEKLNLTRALRGARVDIRAVTVLETNDDGLLKSIRFYAETTELYSRQPQKISDDQR